MIGSGFALDAVRRIERATRERQARFDARHDRRLRRAHAWREDARRASEGEPAGEQVPSESAPMFTGRSGRLCPECDSSFILADLEGIKIDTCMSCGGLWFDAGELKALTREADDVPDEQRLSKKSKYACPVCGNKMSQHQYKSPHRLLVDTCPDGHGVYLERGEYLEALTVADRREKR